MKLERKSRAHCSLPMYMSASDGDVRGKEEEKVTFECDFEENPQKLKTEGFNQLEYRCVSLPVLGYIIFSDLP